MTRYSVEVHNDCFARLSAVPVYTVLLPQMMMKYLCLLQSELMARAHQEIQHIVLCDSTASLDRFNTSIFILSTASTTSGIPQAIILTSDEREHTIQRAIEMVKEINFYHPGHFMAMDRILVQRYS